VPENNPSAYSRKNPFSADLTVHRKLTGEISEKDTRHIDPDVDAMLHQIIAKEGGLNRAGATEYVARMKHEKRLHRDVY